MNRKWKITWACLLVLLLVVGGFVWKKRKHKPAAPFKEATVQRGRLDLEILSTGVVQPENRLEIKSPVAGRVEEVLVREGMKVRKGQILVRMSSTERAALMDAARARGASELARWEDFYKAAPISAPINGVIISRNIEPGQTVTTADAIIVMSDRLTVKAQVDETDIAAIQLKQKASLVMDAYPSQTIEAQVDQIAFEAKTINNVTTYIVDVLPIKTPEFMRSGMTANVSFVIDPKNAKSDALLIPAESIKTADGKSYVLVPSPNDEKQNTQRFIEVGASDGKNVEVLSGLAENEKILIPQFNPKSLEKGQGGSSPFGAPGGSRKRAGGGGR